MANVLAATVKAALAASETPDTGFLSGKPFSIESVLQAIFSSGTAADAINGMYAETLTFTASTPQTIDLRSLTDIFGDALQFQKVRALLIRVKSTTDGASLALAPGASNGMTSIVGTGSSLNILAATSSNNAWFAVVAPNTTAYAVGASTKTLLMTPSAHAFDVDVIILGVKV
jgi:hypothetical protein